MIDKEFYKKCAVDQTIGMEEEFAVMDGFYPTRSGKRMRYSYNVNRDNEICDPIIREVEIKEMDQRIKHSSEEYGLTLPVEDIVWEGASYVINVQKAFGQTIIFSDKDIDDMVEDFIVRLKKRLKKYSGDRIVISKRMGNGHVKFGYR